MFTTTIRVNALDNTKGAFGSAMQGLERIQHQLNKVGTQTQLAGFRMTAAITYPLQRFGRSALTAAKDMSEAENQLRAVLKGGMLEDLKQSVPGITESEALAKVTQGMKDLRAEAHRMAEGSRFDIIEVTQAQKYLSMAGLGQQQVLGSTEATIAAATALSMDVATVADKLSNTALGFGLMDSDSDLDEARGAMTKIADVVAFTASRTNVSGAQAFETLKSLGPVARGTGRDLEEMAAMMGVLGNNGIQGAEAGVALRSSIARIAAPTNKMLGLFKSVNLNLDDFMTRSGKLDSGGLFKGLLGTGLLSQSDISKIENPINAIFANTNIGDSEKIAEVRSVIKDVLDLDPADLEELGEAISTFGMSTVSGFNFQEFMKTISTMDLSYGQLADIFGKRHVTKMQALMYGIVDSFRIEDEIRNGAAGQANRMLEEQMAGLYGALEKLRSTWKNFQTNLFTGEAGDLLIGFIEKLRGAIQWLDGLNPAIKTTVMVGASLLAVLGPLLIYLGMVIQFGGVVVGVFTGLAKGIGVAARVMARLPLRSMTRLFSGGAGAVGRMAGALRKLTPVGIALTFLISIFKSVKDRLSGAADQVRRFWRALKGVAEYFAILNFRKFNEDSDGVRRASIIMKYHIENLVESFKILAKEIGLGVLEGIFGKSNLDTVLENFGKIKKGFDNITEAAGAFFKGFQGEEGTGLVGGIMDLITQAFRGLQDRLTLVIEVFGWLMEKVDLNAESFEAFGEWVRSVVDWLAELTGDTIEAWREMLGIVDNALEKLGTYVAPFALDEWNRFKEDMAGVWDFITTAIEGTIGALQRAMEAFRNWRDGRSVMDYTGVPTHNPEVPVGRGGPMAAPKLPVAPKPGPSFRDTLGLTGPSIMDQFNLPSVPGGATLDPANYNGPVVSPEGLSGDSLMPQEDVMASAMTRALDRKFGEGNLQAKLDGKANVVVSLKGFPNGTTANSTSKGDVSTSLDLGGSSLSA
ncbi:phage tail tape measure protein [Sulfitobacter sp. 1A15106]|uniref:phage tail tape measure protein n=1 Tax=Sulfitobacter sp. 1A15106 TaxID=3368590 RepID=UPI0037475DAE